MNDFGRGNGVTDKFLKNFYDLFELKFDQDKISFEVFTKPTLSKQTFHFLDTEEKCFKWFKFFNDKMYLPWKESKASWIYGSALFNLAQPTEWTPDDGYAYAKISNNLKNIREKVQKECEEFLVYKSLVPEANLAIDYILERSNNSVFLNLNTVKSICQSKNCGGGCGSFSHNLVLIPKGKFTMCHRGIFDGYVDYVNTLTSLDNMNNLATEYFKNTNVKDWIFTAEEFKQMSEMMLQLYEYPSCIWYTDIYKMIKEYAVAGVIDKKYLKDENIYPTLGYFLKLSSCIQDNYIFNGSWVTHSFLELPVLYNGTMDVVLEEYERVKGEKQHYDI